MSEPKFKLGEDTLKLLDDMVYPFNAENLMRMLDDILADRKLTEYMLVGLINFYKSGKTHPVMFELTSVQVLCENTGLDIKDIGYEPEN